MPTVTLDIAKDIVDLRLDLINSLRGWEGRKPNGNTAHLLTMDQAAFVKTLPEKVQDLFSPMWDVPVEDAFDTITKVVKSLTDIKIED